MREVRDNSLWRRLAKRDERDDIVLGLLIMENVNEDTVYKEKESSSLP